VFFSFCWGGNHYVQPLFWGCDFLRKCVFYDKYEGEKSSFQNIFPSFLTLIFPTPCRYVFGTAEDGTVAIEHPTSSWWISDTPERFSAQALVLVEGR